MKKLISRITNARKRRLTNELENKSVETYLIKLSTIFTTPTGFMLSMITAVMAYFAPIWIVMLVLLIFVVVDFVTGILASKKLKMPINSKSMRATVTKLFCYFMTIILAFLLQTEIIKYKWFEITNLSAGFIALAEFKSILENFGVLTDNKIFSNIFKKINDLFKQKRDIENNNQQS